MAKTKCEIYLAINEDGDFEVRSEGESEATEALVENYGGTMVRVVKITAFVTAPKLTEAEIDVSDEAGATEPVETEAA